MLNVQLTWSNVTLDLNSGLRFEVIGVFLVSTK